MLAAISQHSTRTGASKGIPGDAKYVTEILRGGDKNKEVGGNTVLLGHSTVPLPVQ